MAAEAPPAEARPPLWPAPAPADASAPAPGDEITLRDLLDRLVRGKWLILIAALLSVAAAAVWLRTEDPVYTATMVVAPTQGDIGALANLASRIEEYAALATIGRVPAAFEPVSSMERYGQLLGSVELAERLQAKHGFLQRLLPNGWDPERQTWQRPEGPVAAVQRAFLGFFGHPDWAPPTPATLAAYLNSNVLVRTVGQTSMRQVRFDNPDPALAVELLRALHVEADGLLREEAAGQVASQIVYLEREIAEGGPPARRQALESMVAEQYRAQAMLEGGLLAAAQVVDRPSASDLPTSPSPAFVLAVAAAGGLFAGVFLALLLPILRGVRR
ncbi:MAG TPA: Wzz/FepE/Etk N-terminal domain-containing protein [Geminicoccaceae bacterium]|nr:Wzz/FepE/Etk N-terminal domain-containing protein [Geminicoccaceae bacterium]